MDDPERRDKPEIKILVAVGLLALLVRAALVLIAENRDRAAVDDVAALLARVLHARDQHVAGDALDRPRGAERTRAVAR